MSTTNKRRGVRAGQPEPELSRLKELWLTLSDDARAFWRARLQSGGAGNTQPEIRRDLLAKLKINLRHDNQLSNFKSWMQDQDGREEEAEKQTDDERQLVEQFGDSWTLDQIRDEVLKRSYARALATGDFAAGRKTIVQDLNVKKITLDRDKFEFNAAKAALANAAQLKTISASKLSDVEKIDAARRALFGELPEDKEKAT